MPLEAVLLDLDNTLILYDELRFFRLYLQLASVHFSDLVSSEEWQDHLLESTQALLQNRGSKTNERFFLEDLGKRFGEKSEAVEDLLRSFNNGPYEKLRSLVAVAEGAEWVVNSLKGRGLRLVLATNPILPLDLQLRRLAWAGIRPEIFELITHMGNMSYCKPQVEYFTSICDRMNVSPSSCLMVGNDPVNDMTAGHAGLKTYLTTDAREVDVSNLQLSRRMRKDSGDGGIRPDFEGPLIGVIKAVTKLKEKTSGTLRQV